MRTWTLENNDGSLSGITHCEHEASSLQGQGFRVIEVVPASEVREKDELIQKLADTIADETGATFMEMTFGLRKVGGKWERVNG